MSVVPESPNPEPLDRLWEKWKVVIDLFARQSIARHQIRADAYRTLHRQLLQSCESNTDARYEQFAHLAADIVRPWTNLESLNDAPTKILTDVRNSCLVVDLELQGKHSASLKTGVPAVVLFIILFVSIFLITLLVLFATGGATGTGGTGYLKDGVSSFQHATTAFLRAFEGRFHLWILGGLGVGVALFLAYISLQSTRKY